MTARDRFIAYCTGPDYAMRPDDAGLTWDTNQPLAVMWRAAEKAGRECAREAIVFQLHVNCDDHSAGIVEKLTDDELAEGGEG
jgi:hypothetical protein